jgi:hypothetical protein
MLFRVGPFHIGIILIVLRVPGGLKVMRDPLRSVAYTQCVIVKWAGRGKVARQALNEKSELC